MPLIDSHCHLNYLEDAQGILQRAAEADVAGMLCIGVDQEHMSEVLDFAVHDHIWATAGEHPGACSGDASWVAGFVDHPQVVALGEMGLDYFYEKEPAKQAAQRHTFAQQLELAANHKLPVVIHTREAQTDTLDLLNEQPDVVGVLHCFTESWEMASAALDMGFYISISGIVTFRNADNVREVAEKVPQDRLLVETDAPWLAPVPQRGATNEPAFVAHTARYLADLRNEDPHHLAQYTSENFFRLFSRAAD